MLVKSAVALPSEIFEVILVIRHVKMRKLSYSELELDVTSLGDFMGILNRALIVLKQSRHLVLGFHIKLVGLKLHSVGIVKGAVGLYAQQNTVDFAVLFFYVMAVVGRDHSDANFVRNSF